MPYIFCMYKNCDNPLCKDYWLPHLWNVELGSNQPSLSEAWWWETKWIMSQCAYTYPKMLDPPVSFYCAQFRPPCCNPLYITGIVVTRTYYCNALHTELAGDDPYVTLLSRANLSVWNILSAIWTSATFVFSVPLSTLTTCGQPGWKIHQLKTPH